MAYRLRLRTSARHGVAACAAGLTARRILFDPRELARRDRGVFGRTVAIPGEPRGRPHEADGADDDEAEAPAPPVDQQQRDRHRQHAADARSEEHDAVGLAALTQRKPHGQAPRHTGERPGLAGAEQEPCRDERLVAGRRAGQHREGRPPQHDACEHPARAGDVHEPSRRDLEEGIRERKGAQHLAHLKRGQAEIVGDERCGRRNADTIQVGDDGEEKREEQDARAGSRSGGGIRVHRRYSSGS